MAGGGATGKVAVRGVWAGEKPPVATDDRDERMLGEKWYLRPSAPGTSSAAGLASASLRIGGVGGGPGA